MTLSRQVTVLACGVVAVAVLLTGLVTVGLVRHSYDGQARAVLHREATLVARLAERPAQVQARRPATRVLASAGIQVARVRADGQATGALERVDAADRAAAAAGESLTAVRDSPQGRVFVAVEPVGVDGGVVLTQRASDARAVSAAVLRRVAIALLIGLVVAGLLGAALARRLSRPLTQAARAAHRLAAGERQLRVEPAGPAEVAEVASALNTLVAALTRSEARQREFLLSVSHELRTPLTGIRGFAEGLADGVVTDPAAAGVAIEAEAGRLQRLVQDLLDLARLGADDFRLHLDDVDLTDLLRAAATVWGQRCVAAGATLRVEEPAGPLRLRTDPGRVRQVLDALADNALKVMAAGDTLVLAVRAEPGTAVLEVRDSGPGLSDDDLAVAFDRAALHTRYRGRRPGGVGIGLALVARLVERLGGTARAGHAPEGGAAFTVRLPLAGPPR